MYMFIYKLMTLQDWYMSRQLAQNMSQSAEQNK